MKKALAGLMFLLVLFCAVSVLNAQDMEISPKVKGASEQAYQHASENSVFNRISDWFATVGKSEEEKVKILAERNAKRAQKALEKAAKKAKKEAAKTEEKARQETPKMQQEKTKKQQQKDLKSLAPQ